MRPAKVDLNDTTVNRFRARRGRRVAEQIAKTARLLGRNVRVLDVGGRPKYWENVGFANIERIEVMNCESTEIDEHALDDGPFVHRVGDARDLSSFADGSVDFVHSNSVLEHVGRWQDMKAMAREVRRVGQAGWVQTPAWEFPIEMHFKTPFVHWFGKPVQQRCFFLSASKRLRSLSLDSRRKAIDSVNLVSRREMMSLFPGDDMFVERVVFAKSYSVHWLPA